MIGLLSMLDIAQGGVSVAAFAVLLIACATVGLLLLRRARHAARIAWILSGLAALAALAFTLWPNTGSSTVGCSVEFSWNSPFEVQNLANIALLVPVAFFATIASRRPLPVAAAGTGLSAAIELTQALAPALNRACVTEDWQMNTIGALLGAAVGWWTTRLAARSASRTTPAGGSRQPWTIFNWIWTGVAAASIATWFTICAVDPIPGDPCAERAAGAATALPGGISIRAGDRTGHLCITGPDGGFAGLSEDPAPGTLDAFGTGEQRWSIGIAPAGALTARDDRGRTTTTHAVQGSTLRVWSTSPRAGRTTTSTP